MIPKENDSVKLVLKNSYIVEGVVSVYNHKQIILEAYDKKSFMIINDPKDVMLIHVFNSKEFDKKQDNSILKETIELKFRSIAELKEELIKQELQEASEKVKSHEIDSDKTVKYELPSFFKQKGINE